MEKSYKMQQKVCSKSEDMLLFLLRHQKAFSLQVIFRHVVKRSFFVTKWSKAETFITNILLDRPKLGNFNLYNKFFIRCQQQILMPGPKMFCAGPIFLSQPKNLTAFSASSKTFVTVVRTKKPISLNANHRFA